MDTSTNKALVALIALQETLGEDSSLQVIHEGGQVWQAHCTFSEPAPDAELEAILQPARIAIPSAYRDFLRHYNGALLFYDMQYGQWGFRLYGAGELIRANARWHARYEGHWRESQIAIAESCGDGDLVVLDTLQPSYDGYDCAVVDGDSGYLPSNWAVLAPSFGDWIDRLVVAQGAKYWRWR